MEVQNAVAGPSTSPKNGADERRRPAKRQNVSKACLSCRKRKSRCDGVQPTCGGCARSKFQCTWASDEDGRKPVSKSYVNALEARIRDLEKMIEAHGGSAPSNSIAVEAGSDSDDDVGQGGTEEVSQALGNLLFNGGGEAEVSFYGPTSAFHHLPRSGGQHDVEPVALSTDHRRYLPQQVPLSAAQHSIILDRFFRYFASWGLRVSPQSFHRDLVAVVSSPADQPSPRTHCYSPLLHNAILSVAVAFADEDDLKLFEVRRCFANEAQKHMEREGQKPTLASVQGFAILSSFHSSLGGHSHGWLSFGLASRAAEALGLNVDCSSLVASGRLSELDNKERNHTFWTVFAQEQLWAVYIGRAHTKMEFSTPLPEVDEAIDKVPWEWSRVRSNVVGGPSGSRPSMMSTTFVETAKLAILISDIMSTVYGLRAGSSGLSKVKAVSELRLALEKWYEQLPESLRLSVHSYKNALPHILTLHLAHEWLLILLHRPSYRPVVNMPGSQRRGLDQDSINYAVKTCDRAAHRILQLLKQWHMLFDLAYTNITMPQIAFTAGTTHLLAAVQHRSAKRHKEAITSARDCVDLLRRIGISWTSGSQKADILENLINEYVCSGTQPPSAIAELSTRTAAIPAQSAKTPPQLFGIGTQGQAYQPTFLSASTEAAPSIDTGMFSMDFSSFNVASGSTSSYNTQDASPPFFNSIPQQTSSQLPAYQPQDLSFSSQNQAIPGHHASQRQASAPIAFDHRRYSVGQQQQQLSQPIDMPASSQSHSQDLAQSLSSSYHGQTSSQIATFGSQHQIQQLPMQQQQPPQLPYVTPEFFQALLHHMGLAPPAHEAPAPVPPPSSIAPPLTHAAPPSADAAYSSYVSSSLQSHEEVQPSNKMFAPVSLSPSMQQPGIPAEFAQFSASSQQDLFPVWSPPAPSLFEPSASENEREGGTLDMAWASFFGSTA